MKEGLRSVGMKSGVQFVMLDGVTLMHKWLVNSSAIQVAVSKLKVQICV